MNLRKTAISLAMAGIVFSAGDAVAAAPAAALDKTITINFSVNGMSTTPEGRQHGFNTFATETIYVSAAGRLFVRHSMNALRGGRRGHVGRQVEVGPEGRPNMSFQFRGNALVAQIGWKNGARQMTASFDAGFTSCSVSVLEGRSSGQEVARRGPNGILHTIQSSTISNATCSVQSGNAFGG